MYVGKEIITKFGEREILTNFGQRNLNKWYLSNTKEISFSAEEISKWKEKIYKKHCKI